MREEKLVLREINCGLRVGSNSCKVKFGVMVYKGWDGCLKHTVITYQSFQNNLQIFISSNQTILVKF